MERYAYDPYASVSALNPDFWSLWGNSPDYANQVGFTGRWLDETGMWYFRARYLEPVLGRFVQRDPSGTDDSNNIYCASFVPNGMDPAGETTLSAETVGEPLVKAGPHVKWINQWKLSDMQTPGAVVQRVIWTSDLWNNSGHQVKSVNVQEAIQTYTPGQNQSVYLEAWSVANNWHHDGLMWVGSNQDKYEVPLFEPNVHGTITIDGNAAFVPGFNYKKGFTGIEWSPGTCRLSAHVLGSRTRGV